ncbi:uncharacterized protein PSFLO_03442 [Pseudozyma flocculosa]|uniref:Uncharacterized protein n=1 Tax=Pseudozyma flocculosa TaxID=84751 RepID=A0A5C3F1S0_9BASI|nr:uncharacterized protein PSFLO_03442 [Pseudozyma flocculosa]
MSHKLYARGPYLLIWGADSDLCLSPAAYTTMPPTDNCHAPSRSSACQQGCLRPCAGPTLRRKWHFLLTSAQEALRARAGPFATRPFAKSIRRPPTNLSVLPPPPDATCQPAASCRPRPAARPCEHLPAPASTTSQPRHHPSQPAVSPAQPLAQRSRQSSAAAHSAYPPPPCCLLPPNHLAAASACFCLPPPPPSIVGDFGEASPKSLTILAIHGLASAPPLVCCRSVCCRSVCCRSGESYALSADVHLPAVPFLASALPLRHAQQQQQQ